MIAAPPFAVTRIQPPRRPPGWVDRPRLQHRLRQAALEQPLTLLCAAAGYGKTAALAQLIQALPAGSALAWLGADADEQLPGFLACLCAAMLPLQLPWRVPPDALATLALADRGLREVAGVLLDALDGLACPRGLIVIDDAHRIVDGRVFELLQMVVERLPAHWGLVLASRTEPPMALARWRATGLLAEFRQAELQFDAEEVQALVRRNQAPVAPARDAEATATATTATTADTADTAEQARGLLARTQGWAAGLRLSLAAGPGAARGHERLTQRHLFDFLATEVLADMPPRLREFLMRSAVLPELTAERCARVTGMADAAALLDEVDRRGLFVTVLAAQVHTLRLHDLFREFLEDRLRREQPQDWAALLCRAAEDEPDVVRAVGYLVRAQAWGPALAVLGRHAPALLASGGGSSLAQLLAQFPPAQYEQMPDLWMLRGLTAWPGYDFDALMHCMHQAVAGYAMAGRERDAALASAHLCAGLQHMGRFDEGSRILERLSRLPLDDAAMAFIHYGVSCDAVVCGRPADVAPAMARMLDTLLRVPDPGLWQQCPLQIMMAGAPGTAVQLTRYADAILGVAGDRPSPLRAGAWHVRSWRALLAGRVDEALDWLARSDEDYQQLGCPRMIQTDNRMLHGLLHALRGEAAPAVAAGQALIDDIRRAASPSHRRVHEPAMLFNQARAAWLLQDGPLLRQTAAELARTRHVHEWPSGLGVHAVCEAMLAFADGRIEAGVQLLQAVDERLECHFLCSGVQRRVMLAWGRLKLQDRAAAAALLKPLLAEADEPESGAIILAGEPMLADLHAADWQGLLPSPAPERLAECLARVRRARLAPAGSTALLPQAVAPSPPKAVPSTPALTPAPPPAPTPTPRPHATDAAAERLTPREQEILALLAAGDSNKLIARALGLSAHTVKQHVASVLGKLGVASRGQAAAWWHAQSR